MKSIGRKWRQSSTETTENATAGPSSDIDLIVHVDATEIHLGDLNTRLDGWSLCLGDPSYRRTGYTTGALFDVHIATDGDVEKRTSYAPKIDAVSDPALKLPIGRES